MPHLIQSFLTAVKVENHRTARIVKELKMIFKKFNEYEFDEIFINFEVERWNLNTLDIYDLLLSKQRSSQLKQLKKGEFFMNTMISTLQSRKVNVEKTTEIIKKYIKITNKHQILNNYELLKSQMKNQSYCLYLYLFTLKIFKNGNSNLEGNIIDFANTVVQIYNDNNLQAKQKAKFIVLFRAQLQSIAGNNFSKSRIIFEIIYQGVNMSFSLWFIKNLLKQNIKQKLQNNQRENMIKFTNQLIDGFQSISQLQEDQASINRLFFQEQEELEDMFEMIQLLNKETQNHITISQIILLKDQFTENRNNIQLRSLINWIQLNENINTDKDFKHRLMTDMFFEITAEEYDRNDMLFNWFSIQCSSLWKRFKDIEFCEVHRLWKFLVHLFENTNKEKILIEVTNFINRISNKTRGKEKQSEQILTIMRFLENNLKCQDKQSAIINLLEQFLNDVNKYETKYQDEVFKFILKNQIKESLKIIQENSKTRKIQYSLQSILKLIESNEVKFFYNEIISIIFDPNPEGNNEEIVDTFQKYFLPFQEILNNKPQIMKAFLSYLNKYQDKEMNQPIIEYLFFYLYSYFLKSKQIPNSNNFELLSTILSIFRKNNCLNLMEPAVELFGKVILKKSDKQKQKIFLFDQILKYFCILQETKFNEFIWANKALIEEAYLVYFEKKEKQCGKDLKILKQEIEQEEDQEKLEFCLYFNIFLFLNDKEGEKFEFMQCLASIIENKKDQPREKLFYDFFQRFFVKHYRSAEHANIIMYLEHILFQDNQQLFDKIQENEFRESIPKFYTGLKEENSASIQEYFEKANSFTNQKQFQFYSELKLNGIIPKIMTFKSNECKEILIRGLFQVQKLGQFAVKIINILLENIHYNYSLEKWQFFFKALSNILPDRNQIKEGKCELLTSFIVNIINKFPQTQQNESCDQIFKYIFKIVDLLTIDIDTPEICLRLTQLLFNLTDRKQPQLQDFDFRGKCLEEMSVKIESKHRIWALLQVGKSFFNLEDHRKSANLQFPNLKSINKMKVGRQYKKLGNEINGIENLGCICFASSVLQQLANIPEFTDLIMKYPIEEGKQQNYNYRDDLLCQFQIVLRNLRSDRQLTYYPESFFQAFKQKGEFVNLQTYADKQQDPSLFLRNFLEQIQSFHPITPKLQSVIFEGMQNVKMICKSCKFSKMNKSKLELLVQVKEQKNLQSSLWGNFQEEKLDGYKCDGCKAAGTTVKKNEISHLPNVLTIQLKRFEFDYQTLQEQKVNDYFEFQPKLNLKAYTANQNLSNEYYEYELSGAIIHCGQINSGHYISWIKLPDGRWVKADDEKILYCNDYKQMVFESFGGEHQVFGREKSDRQNAFILVYRRPRFLNLQNQAQYESLYPELDSQIQENQVVVSDVYEEKLEKAFDFMNHKQVEQYLENLLNSTLGQKTGRNRNKLLKFMFKYFLTIVSKRQEISQFWEIYFITELVKNLTTNMTLCNQIIATFLKHLNIKEQFIDQKNQKVRQLMCCILIHTYQVKCKEIEKEKESPLELAQQIFQSILSAGFMSKNLPKSLPKEYFHLLYSFAQETNRLCHQEGFETQSCYSKESDWNLFQTLLTYVYNLKGKSQVKVENLPQLVDIEFDGTKDLFPTYKNEKSKEVQNEQMNTSVIAQPQNNMMDVFAQRNINYFICKDEAISGKRPQRSPPIYTMEQHIQQQGRNQMQDQQKPIIVQQEKNFEQHQYLTAIFKQIALFNQDIGLCQKEKEILMQKRTLQGLLEMSYSRLGKYCVADFLVWATRDDDELFQKVLTQIGYRLNKLVIGPKYVNINSLLYILKQITINQKQNMIQSRLENLQDSLQIISYYTPETKYTGLYAQCRKQFSQHPNKDFILFQMITCYTEIIKDQWIQFMKIDNYILFLKQMRHDVSKFIDQGSHYFENLLHRIENVQFEYGKDDTYPKFLLQEREYLQSLTNPNQDLQNLKIEQLENGKWSEIRVQVNLKHLVLVKSQNEEWMWVNTEDSKVVIQRRESGTDMKGYYETVFQGNQRFQEYLEQ